MNDSNRIALVTGANKGIGLEIARQLAQAGVSSSSARAIPTEPIPRSTTSHLTAVRRSRCRLT